MNRREILAKPRENEAALRARGVSHAAWFGSRAWRCPSWQWQWHRHYGGIDPAAHRPQTTRRL